MFRNSHYENARHNVSFYYFLLHLSLTNVTNSSLLHLKELRSKITVPRNPILRVILKTPESNPSSHFFKCSYWFHLFCFTFGLLATWKPFLTFTPTRTGTIPISSFHCYPKCLIYNIITIIYHIPILFYLYWYLKISSFLYDSCVTSDFI